jgi:two-component system LytT family sensor kinase
VADHKLILITLLVKLGIAASVSSAVGRSRTFQRLLMARRRTSAETVLMLSFLLVPLTLGVWARITVPNFLAADMSLDTVTLIGLLVGPVWAMLSGMAMAVPAVLHREYLTLPFLASVGMVSGVAGLLIDKEEIWSFTPFVDLSLWRWVRRTLRQPKFDRQILLLLLIAGMEAVHGWLATEFPRRMFALRTDAWWLRVLVWLCAPMVVGISLKVWNALRVEMKLEEQKRLVLEARLDALQRQINPHFLFNTLNSIASLVRHRPDEARVMIVKLASLLRAMLKDHDSLVPLREELGLIEDYLDIEIVRFGAEKLRVVEEIELGTLELKVPSILLQPLVENSIKHGLEPRIGGGTITLRSRREGDALVIEVEDDGVGMAEREFVEASGNGIGMKLVRDRLQMIYGANARFDLASRPGRGTRISLMLPVENEGGWPPISR